jgi:hypothetical protein
MVEAILGDRKIKTRRVVKPKHEGQVLWEPWHHIQCPELTDSYGTEYKPRYEVGNILWVRETWCERLGDVSKGEYIYKAHKEPQDEMHQYALNQNKWRPSLFMPRKAARIFLRVMHVWVERLQDITEEDARDEGVRDPYEYQAPEYYDQAHFSGVEINKCAFAGLWDSLNSKRGYSWEANPWVWVYTFERCGKPLEVEK